MIADRKKEGYLVVSILFLTFYTAPLFTYCPIRFSDLGAIFILVAGFLRNRPIKKNINNLAALLFILWCVIDPIFISYDRTFNLINHITQFVRLSFAVFLYLYSQNLCDNFTEDDLTRIFKRVLIIHLWVQLIYVGIYYIGLKSVFNLVYTYEERGALIENNYRFFNHFIIVNLMSGHPRFSGLFEEPAWMGWTLNLLIAYILQVQVNTKKIYINRKDWTLILGAYIFTSSISAIISLFIIWLTWFITVNPRYKLAILSSGTLLIIAFISFLSKLDIPIVHRIHNISEGSDGSTSFRIIGSFNGLMTLLFNNPMTGYGLGDDNKMAYYGNLSSGTFHGIRLGGMEIIDMHNMLFQVICNLGIIGGLLFVLMFCPLSRKKGKIMIVAFLLTFFSVNVFNTFFLFFMVGITIYYFGKEKQKRITPFC